MHRRRSAPHTFEGNIAAEKAKLEAQLADLKPGPQMDALRKKIRQLETVSQMSEWLSSPGLRTQHRGFASARIAHRLRPLDPNQSRRSTAANDGVLVTIE